MLPWVDCVLEELAFEDDDFAMDELLLIVLFELLFELVRGELELCIVIGSVGIMFVGVVAAPPQADKAAAMLSPAINCTMDLVC